MLKRESENCSFGKYISKKTMITNAWYKSYYIVAQKSQRLVQSFFKSIIFVQSNIHIKEIPQNVYYSFSCFMFLAS